MLCLQPTGRWKKTTTRCSDVINIVIIVIINNTPHWLAFAAGPSGAHMLGRRAPAAVTAPLPRTPVKEAERTLLLAVEGEERAGCTPTLPLPLVPPRALPASQHCWPSAGLCSTFLLPAGREPFTHSPVLRALRPFAALGLYGGVELCRSVSRCTLCSQRCRRDVPMD